MIQTHFEFGPLYFGIYLEIEFWNLRFTGFLTGKKERKQVKFKNTGQGK